MGEGRLSAEQVERYHRDGQVTSSWRLPDDLLSRMREALDRLIADNPTVSRDAMYCPHIRSPGPQGLKDSDEWLEFSRTPQILDMAEQLIGPDIVLWGTTVFGKPAGSGKAVPWHQDGEYWPIRPLATCSAWIALDDATPENGCLRVIAGSHRGGRLFSHHRNTTDDLVLPVEVDDDEFDEGAARDVVLKAGQVSFHDIYTVHGSRPNTSGRRRAGFVLRLMPTTSHFDHELGATYARTSSVDFGNRPLLLLRGVDRCGRNDLTRGHQPSED